MATLVQHTYRFYDNIDAVLPTTASSVENTKIGQVADTTTKRIRIGIQNTGTTLNAGTLQFKLQYAVAGNGATATADAGLSALTWTDVGATGSVAIWRGFDNATPSDTTITTSLLSNTTVSGSYVESGLSQLNPNAIGTNDIAEYDWVINANSVALATYYVFRVVESTGTLFSSYLQYPRLATINNAANHEQHQWSFVDDAQVELFGDDNTWTNLSTNQIVRMRLMHKDGGNYITGGAFKIKYYNNYADLAADTNGTYIPDSGSRTTEDWEWYDDGSTSWYSHGESVPSVVTSDHSPEPGICIEHDVINGNSYLLDWTAVGTNAGPEHNLSLKYVGTTPDTKYLMRIELDGTMIPISSMHYGSNKSVMFLAGEPPPPAASGYSSSLQTVLLDFPSTTGWTALGGGPSGLNAPETDYFNQGSNCISKNAWAGANRGMIYDTSTTATLSIPTGDALWMWITHLTPNSLEVEDGTPGGLQVLMGSSTSAYKYWNIRGSDTIRDGAPWICATVDPTITGSGAVGSPTNHSFVGGMANLPTTGPSKGSPFGIDAIRYGRKFSITGGDISSGSQTTFASASLYNDNITRKYGQFQSIDGGYLMQGLLEIGTSVATQFKDSDRAILINRNQHVTASFNAIEINNTATIVSMSNCTITSLNTISRGDFIFNDAAQAEIRNCVFTGMGRFDMLTNTNVYDSTFRRCGTVWSDYAYFDGCTFEETYNYPYVFPHIQSSYRSPSIICENPEDIINCTFTLSGSLGHAIELVSPGTFILDGNTFNNYGANDTSGSAIFNNSSGSITLNVVNGTAPTVRNGIGASTTVNNNVAITVTGLKEETEVRIIQNGTNTELAGIEEATDGTTNNRSFTFALAAGLVIDIIIHNLAYQYLRIDAYTIPTATTSIPIQQTIDRNYLNP